MAERYQLSKKELAMFNQDLKDCQLIKEDLERAKLAGVPNVEFIEEAVTECENRINKLKSTYASKSK